MTTIQPAGPETGTSTTAPSGDAAFWRERCEQLQRALDSRIVIEQAKGMLAERFRCDIDTAFEVLRRASRSTRRNIHELAAEVVSSPDTPQSVESAADRSTPPP